MESRLDLFLLDWRRRSSLGVVVVVVKRERECDDVCVVDKPGQERQNRINEFLRRCILSFFGAKEVSCIVLFFGATCPYKSVKYRTPYVPLKAPHLNRRKKPIFLIFIWESIRVSSNLTGDMAVETPTILN